MKYIQLFNNHNEYTAYTASISFVTPNLSWCKQQREGHCTPQATACTEQHEYTIFGEPSYPSTVAASATSFNLSFNYNDTYTATTCEEGTVQSSETVSIEIGENTSTEARTITGTYVFNGISIPYSLTQEGKTITVATPVISCDGINVTITCATQGASIYYQLDQSGGYSAYTTAFTITADTLVESYATASGVTSSTASEICHYSPSHDYSQDYLTFKITSGGTIGWKANDSTHGDKAIQYSINDGEWTELIASAATTVSVNTNDIVRFKGTNTSYGSIVSGSVSNAGFDSNCTATFEAYGNTMSLIYGDNFTGQTALLGSYNFAQMFNGTKIESAENLIFPATTTTSGNCRATFENCTLLTIAPELPATTVYNQCYYAMFRGCSSLTTAPSVLLASRLVGQCYQYMFKNCTSLNEIKCLATGSISGNTNGWVDGVSPTGTFVKSSGASWNTGVNGIPSGWEVVEE